MTPPKRFKLTVVVSEETHKKISYLKGLYGIVSLREFWKFSLSLMQVIAEGILKGQKLALYDPVSDTVEIIAHEKISDLEKTRDESL